MIQTMARSTKAKDVRLNSLADRLRMLSGAHGGITELAQKANVAVSSLSRCSKGAEPSLATALAVCSAAGVSLDWLATGEGYSSLSSDQFRIPFFDVEASAGPGAFPPEYQNPAGIVAIPAGLLRHHKMTAADLCAIQTKGDSMEPTIRNGSLLIVDRSDRQVREGIYVITRGEVLLVKRIQPRENNTFRLKSDNQQYEPEDVNLSDSTQNLHIFGRVIWSGHGI
jgi:phage repressor protein C with HTH and peptisase S24 domain